MGSHDNEGVKLYQKKDFENGKAPEKQDRKKWKNANFFTSLQFAITGIQTALRTERNVRKHVLTTGLVIILGFIFQIDKLDWLFLLLSCALVLTAEMFNSSIENVVDLASDYQFHMRAKRSKDMAAGAVLIISLFAGITGVFIFLPRIWHLIFH